MRNVLEDQKLVESIGANYDIVVANILADVIIPMSAVVQKFMKDDGIFISSGIINIKRMRSDRLFLTITSIS